MASTDKAPGLRRLLAALQEIAPLELAEEWDNVGLLLEPAPSARTTVRRVLLAIDTTGPVLQEAKKLGAGLLVSYHPPIFAPLPKLSQAVPRQRTLVEAIRAGIAIYSPHTALDAAPGGVNDWLAERVQGPKPPKSCVPITDSGQGRLLELAAPVTLPVLLRRIKTGLRLPALRVARPTGRARKLRSIALCPGAGGAVLQGADADVYLTGEMRHHDVLDAVEAGIAVVLCEHTNTERGYLPVLARRLRRAFPDLRVQISATDRDPLRPA